MKCKLCSKKAAAQLRAHKLALCAECYPQWFITYTQRTIEKFHLFNKEDIILIAISGGKDSLALWHVLQSLGYTVSGLYINLGIHHDNYSAVSCQKAQMFADSINSRLIVVDIAQTLETTIPQLKRSQKRAICSICGTIKRYYMNRIASEENATVLATGHNLDDEAASLLGNMLNFKTDYLARQNPALKEKETLGLKKKVKPFCYFSEREVLLYCLTTNIDYVRMDCPYSVGATSLTYKDALCRIEESSPGTKRRFYDEFLKNQSIFQHEENEQEAILTKCQECGMPTQTSVCSVCRMKERAAKNSNNQDTNTKKNHKSQ